LPKLLPAFGAAESIEDDIFNSVDRAVRAALPNCDKDSALLCHARYGFRRGLSVPVIALGGLTRDEIGWTSLATDPVVVLQWPGKIVLSSGAFKGPPPPPPPSPAPPLPPLYTPSRPTKPLHGHEDLVAKCKEIIKGTFKGSDRRIWTETLERNEGPAQPNGDFKHEYLAPGRSIGQEKVLMKGTFGVYVTNPGELLIIITSLLPKTQAHRRMLLPDDLDKKFGVTACHVTCPMPAPTPIPRLSVVSPGGLDLATSIRIALDQFEKMPVKDPSFLKTLVAHWEDKRVGEMVSGKIGVDQKGYREDWALLDVTGQQGSNDEWLDDVRLMRLLEENDLFTGSLDVIGSREPRDEEVVIMNGARTFWTVGKTQSSRITLGYYKRTAPSSDAVKNDAIDVCLHHQIWRMEDLVFGAKSGDSGCAVFAPEGNGLAFVGLLVSLFMEKRPSGTEDLDDFYVRTGLFVPANMLWEQMRVETGKEWDVCRE
jgi:hypothetical protein